MLGFNDTSILVGHFVLSPGEREKRDRRDSNGDEKERQVRKRKMNQKEKTEEITRKSDHRTWMPPPNAIQKKGLYVIVTGIP